MASATENATASAKYTPSLYTKKGTAVHAVRRTATVPKISFAIYTFWPLYKGAEKLREGNLE